MVPRERLAEVLQGFPAVRLAAVFGSAARDPGDWADFRARAMIDWWDWAPTARMINDAAIRRLQEKVGTTRGPR
jgi:hypothetical protein